MLLSKLWIYDWVGLTVCEVFLVFEEKQMFNWNFLVLKSLMDDLRDLVWVFFFFNSYEFVLFAIHLGMFKVGIVWCSLLKSDVSTCVSLSQDDSGPFKGGLLLSMVYILGSHDNLRPLGISSTLYIIAYLYVNQWLVETGANGFWRNCLLLRKLNCGWKVETFDAAI